MKYLQVIDKELSDHLISKGYKLLREQSDIHGVTVWTFCSDGFTFDADNEKYQGKFCFAETPKMTF